MAYTFNPFTGNFDVIPDPVAAGAPATPTKVASGTVFTVAADTQMLFTEEIDIDGELSVDGILVEVV